jgi:p-cumate 2,3-dioxygenase ferredoxin subunit
MVAVCPVEDIPPGSIRQETLPDGTIVALYNVDGQIYATADACTHGAASLSEDGFLDGRIVECSWHFGSFDVTTGEPCSSPCTIALRTYKVEIIDGVVSVEN